MATPKQRAQELLDDIVDARDVIEDVVALVNLALTVGIDQYNTEAIEGTRRSAEHIKNVAAGLVTEPGRSRQMRQLVERGLVQAQIEVVEEIINQLSNPSSRFREKIRANAGAAAADLRNQLDANIDVPGDRIVSVVLSKAFGVVHGGPDVWAALGYAQVRRAQQQAEAQQQALDRLIAALSSVLRNLERPRYDPLWALLVRNREMALACMRMSRANLRRVLRFLEQYQGLDLSRYNQALDQLLAAQGALTQTPEGDAARAWLEEFIERHEAEREELGTFRALYDYSASTVQDAFDRSQWGRARDTFREVADQLEEEDPDLTLRERLEQAERIIQGSDVFDDRGALRVLVGLSDVADLRTDLATVRSGHQLLYRRLAALRRLRPEMEQARQDLGPIAQDIESLVAQIVRLESDMENTQGRLSLLASTPGWVAELALLRGAINAVVGPEVRAALGAGENLAVFGTELVRFVEYLNTSEEVSLMRSAQPPAGTQKEGQGEAVLSRIERLLSAQGQDDQATAQTQTAIQEWLRDLRVMHTHNANLLRALQRVPPSSHPLVDDLNEYIESYAPALDGLQWIIDSGRWSWVADLNADLVSQAGLLAHRLRTLLFGSVQVPRAHSLLRSILEWLEDRQRDLLRQLATHDHNASLQEDSIRQQEQRNVALRDQLSQVGEAVDELVETQQQVVAALPDTEAEAEAFQTLTE